jgi:hypothetical protein
VVAAADLSETGSQSGHQGYHRRGDGHPATPMVAASSRHVHHRPEHLVAPGISNVTGRVLGAGTDPAHDFPPGGQTARAL